MTYQEALTQMKEVTRSEFYDFVGDKDIILSDLYNGTSNFFPAVDKWTLRHNNSIIVGMSVSFDSTEDISDKYYLQKTDK